MVPGLTCALSRQLSTTYRAAAAAEPARVVAVAEVGAAPAGPTRARLRPSAAMADPAAVVVNLPRFMMFPRSCPAFLAYTKDDPGRTRVAAFLNNFRRRRAALDPHNRAVEYGLQHRVMGMCDGLFLPGSTRGNHGGSYAKA